MFITSEHDPSEQVDFNSFHHSSPVFFVPLDKSSETGLRRAAAALVRDGQQHRDKDSRRAKASYLLAFRFFRRASRSFSRLTFLLH